MKIIKVFLILIILVLLNVIQLKKFQKKKKTNISNKNKNKNMTNKNMSNKERPHYITSMYSTYRHLMPKDKFEIMNKASIDYKIKSKFSNRLKLIGN